MPNKQIVQNVLHRPELLQQISAHLSPNNVAALRSTTKSVYSVSSFPERVIDAMIARIRKLTPYADMNTPLYILGKQKAGLELFQFSADDVFLQLSYGATMISEVGQVPPHFTFNRYWNKPSHPTPLAQRQAQGKPRSYDTYSLLHPGFRIKGSHLRRHRVNMSALTNLVLLRPDLNWSIVYDHGYLHGMSQERRFDVFPGPKFEYLRKPWQQ